MPRSALRRPLGAPIVALIAAAAMLAPPGRLLASDHGDTAENLKRIGADLTDVYVFPSAENPANVVLVLNSHGLILPVQGMNVGFDPDVLYQMKIDTTGDYVEDLVIQFRFVGNGPSQRVLVSGPAAPERTGTTSTFGRRLPRAGTINQAFSPADGVTVFAGLRADPFFLDLERFYEIFPDRATPLTGVQINFPSIMDANTPRAPGFRGFPAGSPGDDSRPAYDFLADLNVLSIVIELPRASLGGGLINLWETTSLPKGSSKTLFEQQDRLARPVINEALATVTARQHQLNNQDNPTDDAGQLKTNIEQFLTFPAGRSTAIKTVIESVLVPDVLVADLSKTGPASYLGVETGGATGGTFGGRALSDDVVDINLGVVFGGTVPALGLAPDDGNELIYYATDNVPFHPAIKKTTNSFPYVGPPHQ